MKHSLPVCSLLIMTILTARAQEDTVPTPQWRPVYHFTPEKNWTNDPNGLIYRNGTYHLYNQQNPFANRWGHMSWGHAVSTDLVHWKHLPIAIPETIDRDTTWRFSGCAVWDGHNSSGFCKPGGCMVAVYTADQPNLKKESQFIAYSNDEGRSFTNYEKNPVIDLHKKDFRDPNVTWNAILKKWLMVVALPAEHTLQFYTSPNLKDWQLLSTFGPAGYTDANWECPSLMQLPVEGSPDKKKWVLTVSAAGARKGVFMQYFVGDFDGHVFKNDNATGQVLAVDEGDCFYAAIPWNRTPQEKPLYIGWMVPGPQPTYPWRGQMSVPRDLSLRPTKEGLRLLQRPAAVIRNRLTELSGNRIYRLRNMKMENTEKILHRIPGNAYWMEVVFSITSGTNGGFKICQKKEKDSPAIQETIVGYDAVTGKFYTDKAHSGNARIDNKHLMLQTEPGGSIATIKMQVLVDKSSLEVFCNDGEKVLTTAIFPDQDASLLSAFAEHGSIMIQSLQIWNLSAAGGTPSASMARISF